MDLTALLVFTATLAVAVASPGPGVIALVARVIGRGPQGSAAYVAGFVVGDVVWLSVISSAPGKQGHADASEAAAAVKELNAAPTVVLLDESGTTGQAYGAKTTPHMYVIGKDGTLLYQGAIDNDPSAKPDGIPTAKNYVRVALEESMAGKPVSNASTSPYGCTVKY